ncbi:erythromycin esterase [Dictyobacter vulcani]|uniref:Erythromycin esterase n=1 Tax=Dictyobacter vulcani TaxID=2607529 RepID=A0A5J4KX71_9CHLR|nr:erythromycin esterase family protein [Dictyobacter vulcani]GER92093.1 erythromycin esterase [Dictyobacter vulcani]
MTTYKRSLCYFLMILLCLTGVLTACEQGPAGTSQTNDPVKAWIEQNVVPLNSVEPGSSDEDLVHLQKEIGSASIVGLGEQTHGTHEIIMLKTRLTQFLITRMNFRTFVMENDWGMSSIIDAYINGGSGNLSDIMKQGLLEAWQTQEYQALIIWMRAYNADPTHTTKIHFRGMDCYVIGQGDRGDFIEVDNYIQHVDPANLPYVKNLYLSMKKKLADQPQQVYNLLKAHQQSYEQRSSPAAFALALQNARIIVEAMSCASASSNTSLYIQRDALMAENVSWLHDHSGESHPKMIVWAHDMHIANDTTYNFSGELTGTNNLGAFLRQRYHQDYLALGTSLYHGSYTTYTANAVQTTSLAPPQEGTYTSVFGSINKPLYSLDLRQTPAGPVSNWFNQAHVFTANGVGGEDVSMPGPVKQWFDIIVFLRDTTPAHSLLKIN